MTLIARLTTGVSANLRKFIGVGLGKCCPGNWTGLKIAGSASVFRSASASAAPAAISALCPLPVACRQISRNCSPTFTRTFLLRRPKTKKAQPPKGPCLVFARDQRSEIRDQWFVVSYQQTVRNLLPLLNKIDPTSNTDNYLQVING
jgi:hypothetical protein